MNGINFDIFKSDLKKKVENKTSVMDVFYFITQFKFSLFF